MASTESTWWDKIGESAGDGISALISAGVDRAAQEIAPTAPEVVSQNPNTHAVTHEVGQSNDGTTVNEPVKQYGSGLVDGISNAHLLLGGSVLLLSVALLMGRRS